jgi:hypothetical protein
VRRLAVCRFAKLATLVGRHTVTDTKGSGLEAIRSEVRALAQAAELGERPQRGESTIDAMRASLGHLTLSLINAAPTSDDNSRTLAKEALKAWES